MLTLDRSRTSATCVVAVLATAAIVGCSKSSATAPGSQVPTYEVAEFVSGISAIDGATAQRRTGAAPPAGAGPTAMPEANQNVINGGSLLIRVRAAGTFQVVYVFIGGSGRTTNGYWELRLPAATTDAVIVVTFGRNIPVTAFECVLGVSSSSGPVGAYRALPTRVVPAGTGDVQVSASWDALADVDLHVVDPFGEEIYYGDTVSASGGELDLDSNAACGIDGVNNENIRWPSGRAPQGSYTVRLDYWSSCGVGSTNYVVTVNRGGIVSTFRGTFTGSGTRGGFGSGRHITTFAHGTSGLFRAPMRATQPPSLEPIIRPESRTKLRFGQ